MHQTKVGTALSDVAMLCSGVVQGSGIGPLMFLVHINELIYLLEQHNIKVKMFAVDVKIYLKIINDVDIVQLQRALTSLVRAYLVYVRHSVVWSPHTIQDIKTVEKVLRRFTKIYL